ncbi:MAG: UbiX family flavin prenyltransferase [Nitrospiraceae bacterium]|nr:MAG: UbiX family flavin prenyltransferase [Nitrospiraceae bacterium]
MKSCIVAITGASGSIYGIRLIEELLKSIDTVHLCISAQAFDNIKIETGIAWSAETASAIEKKIRHHFSADTISFHSDTNLAAPLSSGSYCNEGMFVVPCSMKTLSGIANGYASNLIERSADVTLKEGRPLILAPREMPLNAIHLENMLKLARLGVKIAPPIPAFYQKPQSVEDLIDFVIGKILDSAGIAHTLFQRWH